MKTKTVQADKSQVRGQRDQGDPNDPWRVDDEKYGYVGSTCVVDDRVQMIRKSTDQAWLERVLAWKPKQTQSTVRLAAERRLRKLQRDEYIANGKWQQVLPQPAAAPGERVSILSELTKLQQQALALVVGGADVKSYLLAAILRGIEKEFPDLVTIGNRMGTYGKNDPLPLFGAITTAKGRDTIKDLFPLKPGTELLIFTDPITQEDIEGEAVLIACEDDDPEQQRWRVKFKADDEIVSRWICPTCREIQPTHL
jgi:hypothetical protein